MGRHKKNNNPFSIVDGLGEKGAFAVFSEKQYNSTAFKNLDADAIVLLLALKLNRKYYTGKDKNGNSMAIDGDSLRFCFGRETQKRCGFGNPNKTLDSMRKLVMNGFVDVIENNGFRKKANVYRFDTKWRLLDEGKEITLSNAAQIFIRGKYKKG